VRERICWKDPDQEGGLAKYKKEAVTVSFHYLVRESANKDGKVTQTGFSEAEFESLSEKLLKLEPLDLSDERVQGAIRTKRMVPFEGVDSVNPRVLFGGYRAAYWGHAYENTVVGLVPADSLNLRRFYFLLYLAKDGRIYVGVQYLGQYGSYEGVKNTIKSFLKSQNNIVSHSFRQDSALFEDVEPSELHVTVARKPTAIASPSTIGSEALVTFKKKRKDTEFGEQVKRRLLPAMGTDVQRIRKAASDLVNDSGLLDVSDEDIADCTIVGRVNGRRKKVYMISQGIFATQFHISTTYDDQGLPHLNPTREKMLGLLASKIISIISDD
jgi:hypothetical protein